VAAGTILLRDFKPAAVFRSVQFPQPIDVRSVEVEFQDGILRVTAAKAGAHVEQAQSKRAGAAPRKAPAKKKRAS